MTVTAHQSDLDTMPHRTDLPSNSDRHLAPQLMRPDTDNRQFSPHLPSPPFQARMKGMRSVLLTDVVHGSWLCTTNQLPRQSGNGRQTRMRWIYAHSPAAISLI